MKRLAVVFGLVLVALGLLGVSSAAVVPLAGSLDPSFGSGGVVTHNLASGKSARITGVAVQPDGKIVVVADSADGLPGFLLARYLPDGSLDPSFGAGGYVETDFTSGAFADALALQPDGKIVVAGIVVAGTGCQYPCSQFTLARYNPDGSLDTTFGEGGITNTVIQGSSSPPDAVAILPDGKIVAAGSLGVEGDTSGVELVGYEPDGSLDPIFGEGGIAQSEFGGGGGLGGIVVQPDGKIVASGTSTSQSHGGYFTETMVLARFEPNGSLDPTFGNAGLAETDTNHHYDGGPPALQNGKIVVAGGTYATGTLVVARFTASGLLDPTFGNGGLAQVWSVGGPQYNQVGQPAAVLTQEDGKILIAIGGSLVRLQPNGHLDRHFANDGVLLLPSLSGVSTLALALQADEKVLVGGAAGNAWTLARLIGGNNCVVPTLRGKTISQATTTLKKSYCRRGRIATRFSSKVTRGRVISTAPPRGARLPGGTRVELVVSKGKRR
jgi:uncharacterized delta-60 repeat protein